MTALPLEKQKEEIRAACLKANPEIERRVQIYGDGHTCMHHPDDPSHGDNCYKIVPEIRLADVLLAIEERLSEAGVFTKDPYYEAFAKVCELYNLRADDLEQQSPETINFIHSLICR